MANTPADPASIRAERDILRDFFDNAPDMFVSVDASTGLIRECNNTVIETLGRTREDLIGSKIVECYHPDCLEEVGRAFQQFRIHGEARSESLSLLCADGRVLPVSLRVSGVKGSDGRVLFSRSVWRDMSLEREVASLKLQARVQKAQRLESLAVLAGGIAHDFNNLLVGILGNSHLALMTLPGESPVRSTIEDIERASKRAAELTNQMLAYSGRGRFEVTRFNLSKLVEEMGHLLELAITRAVVLRLDMASPEVLIEADATQIRQIVMNLITNASDAIGERSGVVTVRTGTIQATDEYLDDMVHGEDVGPGHYAYVEVSDSGIGMEPKVIERMFDPFFSTKHEGHGLGLAAMLGIVQGHRGAILVYSEVGKGTTIKVLLPLSESGELSATEALPLPPARGGMVLVVDDEEQVRTVAKRSLELAGYQVRTCSDGRGAIEEYREHGKNIGIVLLDMTMPHMDGKETFRQLRTLDHEARVILMSGYNEQDATSDFSGKGLAGFIQKPFLPHDLMLAISRAFDLTRAN